jgi:hypothetical protein
VHQDEFDLMLLRHWTLYDSLVHSRYVATRLGAWKERGAEEIGRLLVTMGLPLDQCREPYATMRAQFKDQLADRLDEFAPRFGLSRLRYRSFHRQLGFKQGVSAADVVHAVTALLEAPEDADAGRATRSPMLDDDDDDDNGADNADGSRRQQLRRRRCAAADDAGAGRRAPRDEEREHRVATAAWQRSFWRAYDALACEPGRRGAARARHPLRQACAPGDCARGHRDARAQGDRESGCVSLRVPDAQQRREVLCAAARAVAARALPGRRAQEQEDWQAQEPRAAWRSTRRATAI